MTFDIPNCTVQSVIDAHLLQNTGSQKSLEYRQREVERIERHVGEITCAIILKEWNNKTKRLPK